MARVFLMIRYPRELGTVGESDWDHLLRTISEDQPLWNIACALGAAVTTSETGQSPSPTAKMSVSSIVSRYEANGRKSRTMSTGSAASYSSSLSSSSSGDVTTQGFYCKSTLPYVERESGTPTPCVVVDMYQNRSDKDMPTPMSMVVQAIQKSIYDCIIKPRCDTCQLSINDIYILRNQFT